MNNFPTYSAVLGAWLCATGFVPLGLVSFIAGSIWALLVTEDTSIPTVLFFAANIFALFKVI